MLLGLLEKEEQKFADGKHDPLAFETGGAGAIATPRRTQAGCRMDGGNPCAAQPGRSHHKGIAMKDLHDYPPVVL